MNKMRADSTWNRLSPVQKARFEIWLFEENLTYQEVRNRAEKELGVAGSVDSVGRYYRSRSKQREHEPNISTAMLANVFEAAGADQATLQTAAKKALGMRLVQVAMGGGDVQELCALGRQVLSTESRELAQRRIELAQDRNRLGTLEVLRKRLAEIRDISGIFPDKSEPEMRLDADKCG